MTGKKSEDDGAQTPDLADFFLTIKYLLLIFNITCIVSTHEVQVVLLVLRFYLLVLSLLLAILILVFMGNTRI